MENAILAEDGIDPATGKSWQEMIDLNSWAMKYLIEEVFGNVDAGAVSQYYYLDGNREDGKISAGPVWDYDLAIGNNDLWRQTEQNGIFANRLHVSEDIDAGWFYALYRKPEFYSRMTQLYQSVFRPELIRLLEEGLNTYAAQIEQAAEMNRVRWRNGEENVYGQIEDIREYMILRIAFLDDMWINGTEYCVVQVSDDAMANYAYYALRPGECLTTLPGGTNNSSSVFLGWYDAETGETFDPTQPIWEDTEICGKRTSSKLYTIIKYGPVTALTVIFAALLLADGVRMKRMNQNGRSQVTKISS